MAAPQQGAMLQALQVSESERVCILDEVQSGKDLAHLSVVVDLEFHPRSREVGGIA